ncbi:MAG: hypothetical protein B7C24_14070 [Bacteroidetes bacterium 4572_77]|nr:MAG: hypothetical protein B7C24_14070 [Bacteroidetes bacterium 4572_77]
MIRGIYIGRYMISGAITMSIFASRAMSKLGWSNIIIDTMILPVVVYILFLAAALIVLYPLLKGIKALIIMPVVAFILALFVYAYYVL